MKQSHKALKQVLNEPAQLRLRREGAGLEMISFVEKNHRRQGADFES